MAAPPDESRGPDVDGAAEGLGHYEAFSDSCGLWQMCVNDSVFRLIDQFVRSE